jgi:hypothetical protein
MLRRLLVLLAIPFLLVVTALAPAQAANGNPHFIKNATSDSLSGSSLVVNFKEAGLPSGATETVTTTATQSVTYECVNGGGKNPSASNKKTFKTTSSVSDTFTADQNGNIVGTETIPVASATSLGFGCPPGQTVTLVSVTYSNVTITDETSGASISLPGSSTYTNPSAPPVR